MHSSYFPRCNIQTYVDDTPQTHTGPRDLVLLDAVVQAVDFVQQLHQHGFELSAKSTIVASDMRLACDIQCELAKHNITLQIAGSGRDLGTDFTAGARRRVTIQTTRANALKRGITTVINSFAKCKKARKLVFTACKPRAWGFAVMGTSPTMAKTMQGNVIKGLGIKKVPHCACNARVLE